MKKVRVQGCLLLENKVLIVRHYNYVNNEEFWLLPGGSVKENETSEEGIIREIREETNLDISISRVLLDSKSDGRDHYSRYITYLCEVANYKNLKIGYETSSNKKIIDLVWVSLMDEGTWNKYIIDEQFYPSLMEIRNELIELKYIQVL